MSDLSTLLSPHFARGANESWKPERLSLADAQDRKRLETLVASGEVLFAYDTMQEQLAELIDTRLPGQKPDQAELLSRAQAHLAGVDPASYGTWVYYPWSKRVAHVLPEAEYRELRTSRNRNKITADEQARLRKLRIGILGLSVGQSSAITLAMEEVGGEYVLADFDALSLSNMNRLRAGVHEVGVHKAILTARAIFELNPYATVELFPQGVTAENMEQFLDGGRRLDLLIEECDDFIVKIMIRINARRLGIPVVMETSDRGLIDVERFDREPERPLLHGILDKLDLGELAGLSGDGKLPIAFEFVGGDQISPRLAASAIEIDSTLKTWPQLASAVVLGGALTADATRRIALGEMSESGRFYVDLAQLVADGKSAAIPTPQLRTRVSAEALEAPTLAKVARRDRAAKLTDDDIRTIVKHALMAPSGGNAQPWHFVYREGALTCSFVPERSTAFLDYASLASYMSIGAVAENIALVAEQLGFSAELSSFPNRANPHEVLRARFAPTNAPPRDTQLFEQLAMRLTNRKVGARVPLGAGDAERLVAAAEARHGHLRLLQEPRDMGVIADILGPGDRLRFISKIMHPELVNEIRWTPEEVERTRDGLDVATLELTPVDLVGLRVASSMGVMDLVNKVRGGRALERPSRKAIAAASAVGLLTVPGGHTPQAMYEGGRALQRLWLTATALGYAFQPMTAIVCLFWRLLDGGDGLRDDEKETLTELRRQYLRLFDVPQGHGEIMLFRVSRADAPSAHSLRRHVEDVLEIVRS